MWLRILFIIKKLNARMWLPILFIIKKIDWNWRPSVSDTMGKVSEIFSFFFLEERLVTGCGPGCYQLCIRRILWRPRIWARAHWPLCLATGGRVFVVGIFIPVGNHYFQALASTLQFVAQVCDRLWLVPATDRAFAYITYTSP